jgi:TonB family protein
MNGMVCPRSVRRDFRSIPLIVNAGALKFTIVLAMLALPCFGQEATAQDGKPDQRDAGANTNPQLHEKALALVEISGTKQSIEAMLPKLIENARNPASEGTNADPRFVDEWRKRMTARLQVADLVTVPVRVYEKYLTADEISEMISIWSSQKDSKPASPSPALQEKLKSILPSMRSDIDAGLAGLSEQRGGEISQEILTEHPDYAQRTVYRVGGDVLSPKLVVTSDPAYSTEALNNDVQGTVTLELVVDIDGKPTDIRVVKSLGFGLDEQAVKAVRKWRFKPGTKGGRPVPVRVTVQATFNKVGYSTQHQPIH